MPVTTKERFIRLVVVTISSLAGTAGLLAAITSFLDSAHVKNIFQNGGTLAVVCFVLIVVVGGLVSFLIEFIRTREKVINNEPGSGFTDSALSDVLITTIEKSLRNALAHKDYNEVIRMGAVLSRSLWLSGRYHARVKIGELVEEASALVGKKKEQAQALIDDLGWTNVVLGNYEEAKRNILHGNEIAKSEGHGYLHSKGLRHLGGIAKRQKSYDDANRCYDEALKVARSLSDPKESKEMIAGIEYALGSLKIDQRDLPDAEKHINTALDMYRELKDVERTIKTISLNADLHLENGEIQKAKDMFREGLKLSRENDRKDQIVFNLRGLSKIYFLEDDTAKAAELRNEADIIAKAIGMKSNQ